MSDEVFVQHRFSETVGGRVFADAIVLPLDEYQALSDKDVEALKSERVAAQQDRLDNPPTPEPVDPVVEAQALADELAALDARRVVVADELSVKVAALPVKGRVKLDAEVLALADSTEKG